MGNQGKEMERTGKEEIQQLQMNLKEQGAEWKEKEEKWKEERQQQLKEQIAEWEERERKLNEKWKNTTDEKDMRIEELEIQTRKRIDELNASHLQQLKEVKDRMKRKKKEKEENLLMVMTQRILQISLYGTPWIELDFEQAKQLRETFDKPQNRLGHGSFGRGM